MFGLFFIYLFVSVFADDDSNSLQSRILYGNDVRIEDYPFYAGLINCGSAILSDVWILTAAHCVVDVNFAVQNYVFVGGESFNNSIIYPYNKVIIHEQYGLLKGVPVNDVALIKLSTPLKFSQKVGKLRLPTSTSVSSKVVFVGRGGDETGKASKKLQKVDLLRLSPEQCVNLVPKLVINYMGSEAVEFVKKTNICAKRETNMPSICFGDSGSPLVNGDIIVGLASYIGGQKCDQMRLGFYVNVEYYVPWIKKHTGL